VIVVYEPVSYYQLLIQCAAKRLDNKKVVNPIASARRLFALICQNVFVDEGVLTFLGLCGHNFGTVCTVIAGVVLDA
jgi:hypothetical protein